MTSIRNLLAASVVAVAFVTPAFAQGGGGGELETGRFMYVGMDGKMTTITANAKSTAMMMRYAKPVKAGTIFFRSGGTLYMAQDRMMPGGVMLFQMMRDSDNSR